MPAMQPSAIDVPVPIVVGATSFPAGAEAWIGVSCTITCSSAGGVVVSVVPGSSTGSDVRLFSCWLTWVLNITCVRPGRTGGICFAKDSTHILADDWNTACAT